MQWMLTNRETDDAVPLKRLDIEGGIDGLTLRWKLSQTFKNTSRETIEAVYTFPVAWNSVVTSFDAVINGERLIAMPLPKTEAEEAYEESFEAGDAPMMLETSDEGLCTVTLGNLKPDDEVTLGISFSTLLLPQNGSVRATIPLCLADRYSRDGRQGNLRPYERVTSDATVVYPATARFTVKGLLAGCTVSVPSHPASVNLKDGILTITVSHAAADRHLVLGFDDVPDVNAAWAAKDPFADEEQWVAALVQTPPRQASRWDLQVDLLLDCSGSMSGVGITKVREALASLSDVLTKRDLVTITRFGSHVERTVATPQAFTKLFRRRAYLPVVERLEADLGGTELEEGLTAVLNDVPFDPTKNRRRIVLLITDGEVWNTETLLKAVNTDIPVFCLGVGNNSVETLLRRIAEKTDGVCRLVTHAEDMTDVVTSLVTAARCDKARLPDDSPLLLLLESNAVLWHSPVSLQQYAGCASKVFLRLAAEPKSILPAGDLKQLAPADDTELAQTVAFAQYAESGDEALAMQYRLLTPGTSLLLVKERESTEKSVASTMINVPQMVDFDLCDDLPQAGCCLYHCDLPLRDVHDIDFFRCESDVDDLAPAVNARTQVLSEELAKFGRQYAENMQSLYEKTTEEKRPHFWKAAFFILYGPLADRADAFLQDNLPRLLAEERKEFTSVLVVLAFLLHETPPMPSEDVGQREAFYAAAEEAGRRLIAKHYQRRLSPAKLAEKFAQRL